MASSQVQIASFPSTFSCVLRDRNRRHNNDDVGVIRKNLKALVKTASPESPPISDENSQNRVKSWIGNKPKKNKNNRLGLPEKLRLRNDNIGGGASSLVQIWEARLNRSIGGNSPIHGQSVESVHEIHLPAPPIDGESESENESTYINRTVEIKSGSLSSVSVPGESEWGGVAETIRRLSNKQKLAAGDSGDAVGGPISKSPMPEESNYPMVTCSPRLLGRQAFSDLVTHLKRNRHRELESLLERKAVSTFCQRGRIQSMLRLRSLKRGLVIQDPHRSTEEGHMNRLEPGSLVHHLREKFQEKAANATVEGEGRKAQQLTIETEKSNESLWLKESSILLKSSSAERLSPRNHKTEEAILLKNETESKMSHLQIQKTIEAEIMKSKSNSTIHSPIITHQEPRIQLENDEANKVESCKQETQETHFLEEQETLFPNGWEEQEEYEDEQSYDGELSYDWFTEISRPRAYWEDLRKSRYLEVMNTRSDKDDICKLLERKTVSDFLQSGLREKIDKLIMSRVQTHPVTKAAGEEKCEIGEEDDEDRYDLSHTPSQIFAQSPAGSWSSQDIGVTPTHELTPLHDLHSTEMETISDLRSQILQLQLEMSELRESVKTCLDVNASLQKSVHRENPLKRKCCVCDETQVETLLYRCGHICTCLKCANELQWSGGKCPICHAKILDVVRVFFDATT